MSCQCYFRCLYFSQIAAISIGEKGVENMDEKAIYYHSNNSEVWAKDVRSKTAIWKRGNQIMQKVMEFCEVGLVTATLLTFKIYYSHQQGESSTELCGGFRQSQTSEKQRTGLL